MLTAATPADKHNPDTLTAEMAAIATCLVERGSIIIPG